MQSRRLPEDSLVRVRRRRGHGGPGRLSAGFALSAMAVGGITMLVLSCGDGTVEPPPPAPVPTAVTVSPGSAALTALGETAQFTAVVHDQNGQVMTAAAVTWTTSDASVAAVDPTGLATAAANGNATITATAGSASGAAAVTVAQVVNAVAVSPAADTLVAFGDTVRLMAEATDANGHGVAAVTEFVWSSSDTLVARVDDSGLVESVAEGEAAVTATAADVTGGAELRVVPPLPTTIAVSPDTVRFTALGQTAQLAVEVREQAGRMMAEAFVSWSSSDTLVAVVDSVGLVTAVGGGTTTVTVAAGDVSDTVVATVTQSAGSVVVSPSEGTVALGDTLRLAAEAFDENGHRVDGAEFLWSSSDGATASVDDSGLVMGVGEGTAKITATTGDASGASEITVENPDRAALVALYEATDGPNWVNSENWLTDAPLGEWYGVETDASGRVTSLQLGGDYTEDESRHGMAGPIPPELGSLVRLKSLNLNHNALTGPIPPELGNLVDLDYLGLRENGLSDRIPPELGNLVNLDALDLRGNRLSGQLPAELGNLVNLKYLWLNVNDLSGPIPSELGNLRKLEIIWLHYNKFTGPFPQTLLNVPLRYMAWNCGVHGLCVPGTSEFVGWLDGIAKDGPFCNASDQTTLANLFELTGGERWDESTGWLGGPALEEWHGVRADSLGRVTALHLSDNGLSGGLPADIADLAQLNEIRIDGNAIEGRLPLSLTQLNLREFHYDDTELCEPADESFQAWLDGIESHSGTATECAPLTDRDVLVALYNAAGGPNWRDNRNWLSDAPLRDWHGVGTDEQGRVVHLNLTGNNLTGVIPPELGELANLQWLGLGWNDLAGPVPPELGELANLQQLGLRGNNHSGPIPPELGKLVQLELLDLGNNDLSGPIPPELIRIAGLWHLNLGLNDLAGPVPPELGELANLASLDLGGNDLSGPIPPEMGKLSNLTYLRLGTNNLSGPIPRELGGLPRLRSLDLPRNPTLAGAVPTSLRDLPLRSLQAGGTDLCVPREPAFEAWLKTVPERWIAFCGERPIAYLTQTVQSHAHPIPLVAGDEALLRVFVTAAQDTDVGMPPVRARFYLDGTERHVVNIAATPTPIPTKVDEGDLGKSTNARIPGRIVRPGLEMVVEIDPDGTLETGLGVPKRIPETGHMALDVREMPVLNLTLIPFLLSERPDSAALATAEEMAKDPNGYDGLTETRDLLPVGDIDVTAHDPVVSTSFATWDVLPQVEAIRALEGGTGHYMGLASGRVTPVPAARVGGWISVSDLRPGTIAHELGHNMSLGHAPCGAAGGLDPSYPERDGSIGAWGYDFVRGRLVEPGSPDLMSYCSLPWIGAYHFAKALRYRLVDESASAFSAAVPATKSLLLWGGVDPGGKPFLNPAFVVDAPPTLPDLAGDYTVTGRDAGGGDLFSLSFAMPEVLAEEEVGSAFAFVLPVRPAWADALVSVTLSGPDDSVTLNRESDRPMVILRDPWTGQVRAFLENLAPATQTAADAVGQAAGQRMQVLFSGGIPGADAWRR